MNWNRLPISRQTLEKEINAVKQLNEKVTLSCWMLIFCEIENLFEKVV